MTTILIADISGPGSHDDVDALAQALVASVQTGAERAGRYRKLNEVRTLVIAEFSGSLPAAAKESFGRNRSPFAVDVLVATEIVSRRRSDAAPDPRESPLLYTVSFPVPTDRETEFVQWYDEEHITILQGCEYWPMTRRFRIEDGGPARWGRHLALHYITDIRAFRSPERTAARNTPGRAAFAAEPWFRGSYNVFLQEV